MKDDEIAEEMERQILGDRCFLDCGCFIRKICTHPNGALVLLDEDINLCEAHTVTPRDLTKGIGYMRYTSDKPAKRTVWLHKKDGETSSDGWWYKETEYLPCNSDGLLTSLEGDHLLGKRTGIATKIIVREGKYIG